jgi:hypothetical protein
MYGLEKFLAAGAGKRVIKRNLDWLTAKAIGGVTTV